jgi:hypothetical protein
MEQNLLNNLISELAQRLENKYALGVDITNDYITSSVDKTVSELREELPNLSISELEIETIKFRLGSIYNTKIGEKAITLNNPDIPRWFDEKKSEIEWSYWNSYKSLLISQARAKEVIKENEKVIDQILDFSGDPTTTGEWRRRGLVMGNVQSGKTQNYLGLINKAVDSGYKIIILLGGHLNDLRKQTQERVDEGIIGKESRHLINSRREAPKPIGVGKFRDSTKGVHAFTTTEGDFSSTFANTLGVNLTGLSDPAIFTVKKQTSVLNSLYEWIKQHHYLDPENGKKLDLPMLLIDDEADYASVNTKRHKEEVTRTNEGIRNILSLFKRHTYIGYTATPFANIFIDPDSEDEAIEDDLFPADFMIKIPIPDDYVGQDHFFGNSRMGVEIIRDCQNLLELKSEDYISEIPSSLKEAVRVFLLNTAIRALRGDPHAHNTMMVNSSHLKQHIQRLKVLIQEYVDQIRDAIESFSGLGIKASSGSKLLRSIQETYDCSFTTEENFDEIFLELPRSINKIKVLAIYQKGDNLDYSLFSEFGLSAIAIGGHRLSRGLTLEGLSVSYFTRNSKAYDTLMQMCRWFGYRPRYKDLCKVYLPFESDDWYSFITSSINELYLELDLMSKSEKRPREFGLKVREHPGSMVITAKNNMQASAAEVRSQDLWGQILRRFRFRKTAESNQKNLEYAENLLHRLKKETSNNKTFVDPLSGLLVFEQENYNEVINFIESIDLPENDIGNRALINQLREMQKSNLPSPKICFYNQANSRLPWWTSNLSIEEIEFMSKKYSFGGTDFSLPTRRLRDTGLVFASRNTQLGNPDDEKLLLPEIERDNIARNNGDATSFDYIAHPSRDFPALIIYLFCIGSTEPADAKKGSIYESKLCLGQTPTLGYSVSIPRPESLRGLSQDELKRLIKKTKRSYQVNKVYSEQLVDIDNFEEEYDE